MQRIFEPRTLLQVSQPPDCFGSLWTYLSASADDCPLTYAGITLYGALDGGYGYSPMGRRAIRAPATSTIRS